jgi:hypothetical protein
MAVVTTATQNMMAEMMVTIFPRSEKDLVMLFFASRRAFSERGA